MDVSEALIREMIKCGFFEKGIPEREVECVEAVAWGVMREKNRYLRGRSLQEREPRADCDGRADHENPRKVAISHFPLSRSRLFPPLFQMNASTKRVRHFGEVLAGITGTMPGKLRLSISGREYTQGP